MEKLDIQGQHIFMSPDEVETWYKKLSEEYETNHLAQYGVKMPAQNSTKALWLVYLRKYQGIEVHKDTISAFVATVNPKAGRDQQVRHLSADGWYVLNKGDKLPNEDEKVPSGYHVLITTENPKPTFLYKVFKRAGRLMAKNFEQLKAAYAFQCATCNSKEGKPNFLEPDKRTELQQAHKNPHKELTLENSIPQCQVCNQIYQDNFVFDDKGRVIAVASVKPVLKADKEVRDEIKKLLG